VAEDYGFCKGAFRPKEQGGCQCRPADRKRRDPPR
jgi:hypothetical protein